MKLFVRQEKRWEENPIARLLIYIPASIISSVLVLPLTILTLPFLVFNKKIQKSVLKFLLYIQHIISLSFWYFIIDILFPNIMRFPIWIEYPITLIIVYIGFKKTIGCFANESLSKTGL